ncbi:hypothetical protein ACH45F_37035, partial [Catenuloplanes sp. NPDC020197]|uniref:hypothetical protein n=1 Tax=Catenuloplanes sp. NPDC020197 TaxID=3363958 RepID=UPI0037AA1374
MQVDEILKNLYSDIVELGGLSNAASEAIAERGLLVSVESDSGSGWTARVEADRGVCYLNVGAGEGVFFFEIHRRNYRILWASGASPDFNVVISVICQWLHGRRAFEVAEEFPFVRIGPLADIEVISVSFGQDSVFEVGEVKCGGDDVTDSSWA